MGVKSIRIAFTSLLILLILLSFHGFCFAGTGRIEFTQAEKTFIKEHPVIHLGVDPEFIPYEFFDTDGTYKGIAADYIKLIGKKTGIRMVVEKGLIWTAAYEKAVRKELDVLPCVSKTEERQKYFLFSEPYYPFQRVIFVKDDNNTIKSFKDLFNKKVAVQVNSSHYSYLLGFSSIRLSLYKTVEEAIAAVADGREKVFVGNYATTSYLIKAGGLTGLKYIKIDTEQKQYLYFAVRNDWPLLVGIINKGLADITNEEKIAIDNRWIGVENRIDYGRIFKIAGIVGAVIAIIFIVSFYWIVKLKKEAAKRIKAQDELKAAKEEAELANRFKSTFLARMSHEIRTPLNTITGMAYLTRKTNVNITQKSYLDKITQASGNMLGIINDILDFSKIEAGKISIESIPFNLSTVITQVTNIISFKIEEQGIDFNIEMDPEMPVFFRGDPTRIEQILLNIVNNAVKFTSRGEVSVFVHSVSQENDIHMVEFRVKDTGIGMSEEQMKQLFTPFSQGDSSINRRFGGTGLGLSIVKSLVEMMGGEIRVSSAVDEGSTFVVLLPLEVDRAKEDENRRAPASVYFREIKVLVLEKNTTYLNLLKGYLKSFEIVSDFADSEAKALHLLEKDAYENEKPYNLLIIDYNTPANGGIEFVERLKVHPLIKKMPKTILIIPLMRDDLFEKIEEARIDLGITKPIMPSILFNGIVEVFREKVLEAHDTGSSPVSVENAEEQALENPYHVLVVEDNKTNRFIAQSILEQAGFKVSLAGNGKEGYDFFSRSRNDLDLILMDLHMPVMNGYEATALIRELDTAIPIIIMTADAITGVEDKCMSMGITRYVSKPFEPDRLISTVRQVVSSAGDGKRTASGIETGRGDQPDAAAMQGHILDEEEGLRHIGGRKDFYSAVLKAYYDENTDTLEILEGLIAEKAYKDAAQVAHKVKGSSGNIGAGRMLEVSAKLQQALYKADENDIQSLHNEFKMLLKQLLDEIEQHEQTL